jgi:hypothetical protein
MTLSVGQDPRIDTPSEFLKGLRHGFTVLLGRSTKVGKQPPKITYTHTFGGYGNRGPARAIRKTHCAKWLEWGPVVVFSIVGEGFAHVLYGLDKLKCSTVLPTATGTVHRKIGFHHAGTDTALCDFFLPQY